MIERETARQVALSVGAHNWTPGYLFSLSEIKKFVAHFCEKRIPNKGLLKLLEQADADFWVDAITEERLFHLHSDELVELVELANAA